MSRRANTNCRILGKKRAFCGCRIIIMSLYLDIFGSIESYYYYYRCYLLYFDNDDLFVVVMVVIIFSLLSEPAEGNVRQGDPNPTSPE